MNETDHLQPVDFLSNDFVWPPPPRWGADAEILWLDPETEPAPTNALEAPLPKAAASVNLPISDLLSSGIPFEWPDVVALVQELGNGLKNSGPSRSLLTLDSIALGADGRLHVNIEPGTVPVVRSLGHVLEQLLTNHPGPANLRLIALQVNSEASTFSSVDMLTQALANFERPGRLKALSALYERAHQAPLPVSPRAIPAKVEPLPQIQIVSSPIPEPEVQAQTPQLPILRRREVERIATLGVATVCLAVTVLALAIRMPQSVTVPQAAREIPQALPVSNSGVPEQETTRLSPPAVRTGVRAVNSPVPVPRPVEPRSDVALVANANMTFAAAPAITFVMPALPQIPPIAEEEFVRARALFDRQQYPAAASGFQRVIDILSNGELSPSSSTLRSTATEMAALSLAAVSSVPDRRVYTRIDEGVIEPVSIRAFLPSETTSSADIGDLSVLELLIDSRGVVESVRLRNPQNRFRDKWWLSAAKSWRFQPALKDGQPVKFLKRMPITAFEPSDPR